jgi:hypothetical protein
MYIDRPDGCHFEQTAEERHDTDLTTWILSPRFMNAPGDES